MKCSHARNEFIAIPFGQVDVFHPHVHVLSSGIPSIFQVTAEHQPTLDLESRGSVRYSTRDHDLLFARHGANSVGVCMAPADGAPSHQCLDTINLPLHLRNFEGPISIATPFSPVLVFALVWLRPCTTAATGASTPARRVMSLATK